MARKHRRRRYAAPIGGLFLLLAAIGVITVVAASINLTSRALDNRKNVQEFQNLIRPVLMFDPAPFDSPADINMNQLLLYSMWGVLTSDKRDTYSYSDLGELMIPATDLDVAANRLFGESAVLEHQDFRDYQTTYFYDEDTRTYYIQVMADLYVYSPSVEEITKESDSVFRLKVGYIPPGDAWTTNYTGDKNQPDPAKYMYYYLEQTKNGYHITRLDYYNQFGE